MKKKPKHTFYDVMQIDMIAYGERYWICDLQRFSFRTRDQA